MPNKLTTEEFVRRAKEKHGDKYDYSKVDYQGANKKVIVICENHKEFAILPRTLLSGGGCTPCSREADIERRRLLSAAAFQEKAEKKHGERYSYDKVHYVNAETAVIITCSLHGDFQQTAGCHLDGSGCQQCGRLKQGATIASSTPRTRLTQEQFVSKAKAIHGDRYGYEKVVYVTGDIKVIIECEQHGQFEMRPSNHINSQQGCPECAKDARRGVFKHSAQEFIAQAQDIHGEIYDYSKLVYQGKDAKVVITCTLHGDFEQEAKSHLRGRGCPACGGALPMTAETFSQKATVMHDSFYAYDKVEYVNNWTKVTIVCPTHGDFQQLPLSHLQGKGCMGCFSQGFSKSALRWLDYMAVKLDCEIQHAQNGGEHMIRNSQYRADGYIAETDTVLEFQGDFHHGNPVLYKSDRWNTLRKCTMGELYDKTITRENFIRQQNYTLVTIWEFEWKLMIKAAKRIQTKWRVYIKQK